MVDLTQSKEEYYFYKNRKFLMLNCVHMVMAIYAYAHLVKNGIPKNEWKGYHLNVLLSLSEISEASETLLKLQALRIMCETPASVLQSVHPAQSTSEIYRTLIKYGKEVMTRITKSHDKLERVLDTSDYETLKNKYTDRIQEMNKFIEENTESIIKLDIEKMPDIETLRRAISHLDKKFIDILFEIMRQSCSR